MERVWLIVWVFLHVFGAAAWVGGQLVLGVATAALRRALPEETRRPTLRALARRAQPLLWTGLALAVLSGFALLETRGGWRALLEPGVPQAKALLTLLGAGGGAGHVWAARRRMHPALVGGGAALALLAGIGLLLAGAWLRWS